jgi:hypothetical protein
MTVYATVNPDLTTRFPRALTSDEFTRAGVLLTDASFWLGVWVPGLDAEVTAGNEVATQAAKLLVVAMVRRTLLQPDLEEGATSQTDTFGPFSFTVAHSNPDGSLFLYDRELADITDLLRSNRAAAVSMRSPGL